jgi:hypothetical protein
MSSPDTPALLSFDFARSFPHKVWISDWRTDESYPAGFRYKLLSARHEDLEEIELIILIEHRDGDKEVLKHLDIAAKSFERIVETFISGLAEEHNLNFQAQDFSGCRSVDSFEAAAKNSGWKSDAL